MQSFINMKSYKVYERGIDLFGFPIAFDLWNLYLSRFIARNTSTKMERARDLFEQALEKCPPKYSKTLYIAFARLEEEHGIAKHAMRIYQRATENVDITDLNEIYLVKSTTTALIFRFTFQKQRHSLD